MKRMLISAAVFLLLIGLFLPKSFKQIYSKAGYTCYINVDLKITGKNIKGKTIVWYYGFWGSCVAVNYKNKTYILTNAHLTNPDYDETLLAINKSAESLETHLDSITDIKHDSLTITFQNNPEKFSGVVGDIDKDIDIAIITPKGKKKQPKIKTVSLTNDNPEIMDEVMTIGNPIELRFIPTRGKILAIYTFRKDGKGFSEIITSSISGEGSSGGPLLNKKGELVGICKGHFTKQPHFSVFIHIKDIKSFLDKQK